MLHVSTAYVARSRGGSDPIPPEPVQFDPATVSALTPLVGLTTRAYPETALPTESTATSEADSGTDAQKEEMNESLVGPTVHLPTYVRKVLSSTRESSSRHTFREWGCKVNN